MQLVLKHYVPYEEDSGEESLDGEGDALFQKWINHVQSDHSTSEGSHEKMGSLSDECLVEPKTTTFTHATSAFSVDQETNLSVSGSNIQPTDSAFDLL